MNPYLFAAAFVAGFGLDFFLGDPPSLARYHPVVLIGRAIAAFEKKYLNPAASDSDKKTAGVLLWATVVGAVFGITFVVYLIANSLGPLVGFLVSALLCWTTIAARDLDRQVARVARLVKLGKLDGARRALSMIVGRDTDELDGPELCRAAFETMAENTSDGVVAPLFFLALGGALGLGPSLGMAYKAVNTLDSMVGYRNEKYEFFGKFSARADDVANWIPARLTAGLTALAAHFTLGTGGRSYDCAMREGANHSSPNAGYPEAAFAGAVGVKLGGDNSYGGVTRPGRVICAEFELPNPDDISNGLELMWLVGVSTLVLGVVVQLF